LKGVIDMMCFTLVLLTAVAQQASVVTFPAAPRGEVTMEKPGVLTVDAVARLNQEFSDRPTLYYWRLEVYRESLPTQNRKGIRHTLVWSQDYQRRGWAVPIGADRKYTFHERLQMPPGRYHVTVAAREVMWASGEFGPYLRSVNEDGSPAGPQGGFSAIVK
jgi:hypothetical protein